MNKLIFEAVRKLPLEWVADETEIVIICSHRIIAVNPNRPPMEYHIDNPVWSAIPAAEADSKSYLIGGCKDQQKRPVPKKPDIKTLHPGSKSWQ